ncbi:sodium channel subunit beta-2 isoform X1 [Bufo bufo]|uniref:sodium channel subunit beta-2 isoform X1 n=1 Tax=Bufo bufo TaxID=8384 RepID=UPI001ABD9CBD|nr:sodium channel subunit beta-2 isoform X1 [Bufo bufo]
MGRRERPTPPGLGLVTLALSLLVCASGMEITVPAVLHALNGSNIRLPCNFQSCYKMDIKQFSMNWTYRGCENCTEETFIQYDKKIINQRLERFQNRIEFTGNPSKNDLAVTIHDVQLEDEGEYHCYVLNPPDRHKGTGKIRLEVLTEVPPERDSTVAVLVGASVGGFLAVVILCLVILKCVRRKKMQNLNSEDQKTEEEVKTDGEGNPEGELKATIPEVL